MAIVNVEGSGMVGVKGVARRLFGTLEGMGVNVVLISQASSEHSITFATTMLQANAAKGAIEEEFHKEIKQVSWCWLKTLLMLVMMLCVEYVYSHFFHS